VKAVPVPIFTGRRFIVVSSAFIKQSTGDIYFKIRFQNSVLTKLYPHKSESEAGSEDFFPFFETRILSGMTLWYDKKINDL